MQVIPVLCRNGVSTTLNINSQREKFTLSERKRVEESDPRKSASRRTSESGYHTVPDQVSKWYLAEAHFCIVQLLGTLRQAQGKARSFFMGIESKSFCATPEQAAQLQRHLQLVNQRHREWNRALGIKDEPVVSEYINYNPVLARVNFELQASDKQRAIFHKQEIQNIQTALRERNQTRESRWQFFIDQNHKIRNELFPDEAYEMMLLRGIEYRKTHGSQELDREYAELDGFLHIQAMLTDPQTPLGTKLIVISPPGIVKKTAYPHNFVDIYELAESKITFERYIKYVRFASDLSYEEYRRTISERIDPAYFDDFQGPIDAWYLAHPIQMPLNVKHTSVDDIFAAYFATSAQTAIKAMEEEEFQQLWFIYEPYVLYYLDQLMKSTFDPIEIAKAWNTILHSTENQKMQQKIQEASFHSSTIPLGYIRNFEFVAAMVKEFGRENVRVVGAGCGSSKGFGFNNIDDLDPVKKLLKNSVAKFGIPGLESEQKWFTCPKCGYQADGPIGNQCPGCKLTKDEYAKEGKGEMCD